MLLAGALATEPEMRRFVTEAEAAANLEHPNIVPVYEVGESDGQHYLAMKLIEGRNLAERFSDFALSKGNSLDSDKVSDSTHTESHRQPAIARLLVKLARAVHYAH